MLHDLVDDEAIMKFIPLSIGEQGFILYAVDRGFLDNVPVNRIGMFEQELRSYLRTNHREFLDKLNEKGDFNDEIEKNIRSIIDAFKATQAWD